MLLTPRPERLASGRRIGSSGPLELVRRADRPVVPEVDAGVGQERSGGVANDPIHLVGTLAEAPAGTNRKLYTDADPMADAARRVILDGALGEG